MEDRFCYTVFFECPELLPSHERVVERYFRNHRKSGGGECGPLRKDERGVYVVAFKSQKDQREVLRRENHEVEIEKTTIKFTVYEQKVSPPHSRLQTNHIKQPPVRPKQDCGTTPKTSSLPPSGEYCELQVDYYLLQYLKDCPKAGKWLDEQLASLHCTAKLYPGDEKVLVWRCRQLEGADALDNWNTELNFLFKSLKDHYYCHFETDSSKVKALLEMCSFQTEDDVKVYSEVGIAIVVGEKTRVDARLNALQELNYSKAKSITLSFGEGKLRLLWRHLEHGLQKDFPKVEATRVEGGKLMLEGSATDVLKAYEFIAEQENLVVETKVSDFSPHYLTFWKKAFDTPEMLSDYLGLDVQIEIRTTELWIFSFSTSSLNEAVLALRRKFELKEFALTNLAMLYALREKVRPTLREINHNFCRVEVLASSDNMVYLVGRTKEVEELSEVVTKVLRSLEEENIRTEKNKAQVLKDRPLQLPHSINLHETSPLASVPPNMSLQERSLERQESHLLKDSQVEASLHPISLRLDPEAEVVARYCLFDELEVYVCLGDITKLEADALVNAANEDLNHSWGVASVISNAGGPEVQKESNELVANIGKICTGDVVVTSGGRLKCKKLLHAVGPVSGQADGRERILLQKAVTSALNLCEIMSFGSIAFPLISTGVFGVPIDVCAEAMVSAVRTFAAVEGRSLTKITLIDKRIEVVRSLRAQCDGLLSGEAAGDADGAVSLESPTEAPSRTPREGVKVEIVQGTIENQQVDAVVSPMFRGDPLSTRIGNCLSETAGQQLMDLYKKQDKKGMPGDLVLVEGLTEAAFRAVFFLDLLPWDNDPNGTPVQVMRLAINNVLTSCVNQGFTSVAFPVLGAGVSLRFPEDIVAQVLHEEIYSFDQSRASTTPFMVNIVCASSQQTLEMNFSCIQESVEHSVSQESAAKRIILLGKTGSGKSSVGNIILGENAFEADDSPNSGTKRCQSKTKMVNGRNITLIDTPGLFDSDRPEEELKQEIMSCITESTPGPHAFLIVLKVDKFTEQEKAIITKICQYFSEEALQYATVVFTHGNQLPKGTNIETFIKKNKGLSELVRKCGNRCHVVDNKYWNKNDPNPYRNNQLQVEALLKTIDEMVKANNWRFYTNKAFKAMEKDIEIEEAIIKENNNFMSKEELRKEAKKRVTNKWLISLTGIGTGVVLGALFGVEALVRLVVMAVQNGVIMKGAQKLKSAVGFAAAGEVALTTAGVVVGAAALGGGVAGGVYGGMASDGAESMQEAYERAKKAMMDKREEALSNFSKLP